MTKKKIVKKVNKKQNDWFDAHFQVIGCDNNKKVEYFLKKKLVDDFLNNKFESKKN